MRLARRARDVHRSHGRAYHESDPGGRPGQRHKLIAVCGKIRAWHISPRWDDVTCAACLSMRGTTADPEAPDNAPASIDEVDPESDLGEDPVTHSMRMAEKKRRRKAP